MCPRKGREVHRNTYFLGSKVRQACRYRCRTTEQLDNNSEHDDVVEIYQVVLAMQPAVILAASRVGQTYRQCRELIQPDLGRIKAVLCLSSGLTSISQ